MGVIDRLVEGNGVADGRKLIHSTKKTEQRMGGDELFVRCGWMAFVQRFDCMGQPLRSHRTTRPSTQ